MTPPAMTTMPRCEVCRKKPAVSFSWFADRERWYAPKSGVWKFACHCTSSSEQYYIWIYGSGRGFFDSPDAAGDWLRHMREKRWFSEQDFFAMLARFEAAQADPTPLRRRRARR